MTNASIEKLSGDLAQARSTIGEALRFVAQISDAESASEAYDRVKLVKEWARIKKLHNEVHRDMLRLEIHCLRKIAQLGPVNVVPAQYRSVATFFKDKSDKDIEELIKSYGQRVTPLGLVKRAQNDTAFNAGYNHVTSNEYRASAVEYSLLEDLESQVTEEDGTYGPNRLTLGELGMRLAYARSHLTDTRPDFIGPANRGRAS